MVKRIIGIVLAAAALLTVLLGIRAGGSAPANKQILEHAVYVSDGRVLPENEGKTLIVTATLEAPLPFVDEKTGVPLHSIVAFRHVQKLAVAKGDEETPDVWRWDFASLEEDYGGSKKLIAPNVTFGEFTVSDVLMQAVNATRKITDYSYANLPDLGFDSFKEEGIVYLYPGAVMPHAGDAVNKTDLLGMADYGYKDLIGTGRIAYDVLPEDADLRYTIIAVQEKGQLEDVQDLKMTDVIPGHLSTGELLEYADSSASTAKTTAFILAAVLMLAGAFLIVRSYRPDSGKSGRIGSES